MIACLWSLTSSWSHNYPAWRPIPSAGPTIRILDYMLTYVFTGTSDAACTSARAYIRQRGRETEREGETKRERECTSMSEVICTIIKFLYS